MGEFVDLTLARVPAGFEFAEPLRQLFAWVEAQGYVTATSDPSGSLAPIHPPADDGPSGGSYGDLRRAEYGPAIGTQVELRGFPPDECADYLRGKLGSAETATRVWPFIRTGADGSMGALWLDDAGQTQIVHLGSGSGSTLFCVLADTALDFLRLLAIGYTELCWDEEFARPPQPMDEDGETVNAPYRDWLTSTFGVTIPATALEIVRDPADLWDEAPTDPFCRWVQTVAGTWA